MVVKVFKSKLNKNSRETIRIRMTITYHTMAASSSPTPHPFTATKASLDLHCSRSRNPLAVLFPFPLTSVRFFLLISFSCRRNKRSLEGKKIRVFFCFQLFAVDLKGEKARELGFIPVRNSWPKFEFTLMIPPL